MGKKDLHIFILDLETLKTKHIVWEDVRVGKNGIAEKKSYNYNIKYGRYKTKKDLNKPFICPTRIEYCALNTKLEIGKYINAIAEYKTKRIAELKKEINKIENIEIKL